MQIGELRRKYFADHDCAYNGLIRDLSAKLEDQFSNVKEETFLRELIDVVSAKYNS